MGPVRSQMRLFDLICMWKRRTNKKNGKNQINPVNKRYWDPCSCLCYIRAQLFATSWPDPNPDLLQYRDASPSPNDFGNQKILRIVPLTASSYLKHMPTFTLHSQRKMSRYFTTRHQHCGTTSLVWGFYSKAKIFKIHLFTVVYGS